jgi:hypothetical protein
VKIELSDKEVSVLILALALAITDESIGDDQRAIMRDLSVRIGTSGKVEP